jgi:hypothetical protein
LKTRAAYDAISAQFGVDAHRPLDLQNNLGLGVGVLRALGLAEDTLLELGDDALEIFTCRTPLS